MIKRIIVTRPDWLNGCYMASIEGHIVAGKGKNMREAIGDLIMLWGSELLNIEVVS